ncbi:MAG: AAA family ATPase [Sandaracinaceae bacterium]
MASFSEACPDLGQPCYDACVEHGFVRGVRLERERVPDFGRYPFDIPAVRDLETLDLDPGVTFFIGENGSGKSTLLEAIAIILGLNPEGGSQNFTLAERPSESELHRYMTPIRSHRRPRRRFFLRAESLFNVATEVERLGLIGDMALGWEALHERSHGEAFLWLLRDRFLPGGLYLLDEPEAALSPKRQLAMLTRMHDLVNGGSQLLIATHSPILMAYPGACIYELDEEGLKRVRYEDTEHVQITRDFLAQPARFLKHLLDDGSGR